ncbi:MAG: heparinase II/III family protein [Deltaproteobacteria bacterium]|nr:heparinase II/III family protein [Deltaproteobacteria bacterium]
MKAVRAIGVVAAIAFASCSTKEQGEKPATPGSGVHPRLMFDASHKDRILARIGREPFATVYARVQETAASTPRQPEPGTWDADVWGSRADIAQANAVLAWLHGDAAAAARSKALLLSVESNVEDSSDLDDDIRMPRLLMGYSNAWDLLSATPWLSSEESNDARARITTVARKLAERYLDQPITRLVSFVVTQNNHPLRAASALGYTALAFPDDPDAPRWRDWAADQMDYLLGPKGHYVQSDGGVSEGPFYHAFGFSAVMRFLIALERNAAPDAVYHHTCITRNSADPWGDHGCVEGEPFTLKSPLTSGWLQPTVDWSISLRRPSGVRANLNDANVTALNGAALLSSFGAPSHVVWDWKNNAVLPLDTRKFDDLSPWYLAHLAYEEDGEAKAPGWRNRFFPTSGHAVFRSGWGTDDRWLVLVADHGPARKTVHNHADGTSFALSAYGEDLLIDTGYYKPDPNKNALTADAPAHNVILVDGVGAPKRGLLNNWGDTDAFLENTIDGDELAWAEAKTSYEGVDFRRGVAFVRQRYFVVADRLATSGSTPRTFQWRAHLWAGHDAKGRYAVDATALARVTVDRDRAGLAMLLASTGGPVTIEEPPFKALASPHVHQVDGKAGNHAVVDGKVRAVAPGFLVVLAPHAQGRAAGDPDAPLDVKPLDAGSGGAAWTIAGKGFRDVAWLRDPGASSALDVPGGPRIATDAAFILVSADGAFALVAGGTTLSLDGVPVVTGNLKPVVIVKR